MAILLVILLRGKIGTSKAGAGVTILALSQLPSGLDHLTLPGVQHKVTFRGPSELWVCDFLCHLDGKVLT